MMPYGQFDPSNPAAPQPIQPGAAGPVVGNVIPQLPTLIAGAQNQAGAQQAFQAAGADANALQQQKQDQQQKPKKHHGWSLNPFQDIGQAWHDVDVNVINPAGRQMRRAYTDVISHPLSAVINLANAADYHRAGIGYMMNSSHWLSSWQASNHISPGQEVTLSFHNTGFQGIGANHNPIDPTNVQAVQNFLNQSHWGNNLASGLIDLAVNMLDPTVAAARGVSKGAQVLRDRPISDFTNIDKVMQSRRTQRFLDWTQDKTAAQIADHPLLAGGAGRNAVPMRNMFASLLEGADRTASENILRVGFGDSAAYDQLAQHNQDLAYRVANFLEPPETMEKFALSPMNPYDLLDALTSPEKAKAEAAMAHIREHQDEVQKMLDGYALLRAKSTSSYLNERIAELRSNAKYANTRGTPHVSFLHQNPLNVPIRIYQSLTDKAPGQLIDFNQDSSVDNVRSWLNKSRVLTPEDKQALVSRYAKGGLGDRPQIWADIEQQTANALADRYGITRDTMRDILNETRGRTSKILSLVKTNAFGTAKGITLDGSETGLLPTATNEALAHPSLVSQLASGAVPPANLHAIESALESMDKNGLLQSALKMSDGGKDFLTSSLDKIYGVWKPLVLLSMHRAYNHIGDDYLRGMGKLGALTTVRNASQGVQNFVQNRVSFLTKSGYVKNLEADWEQQVNVAKAQYQGLLGQFKDQAKRGVPQDELAINPTQVALARSNYQKLLDSRPAWIQPKHRIGSGSYVVPGTHIKVEELYGGPNSAQLREDTSSGHFWSGLVDDTAHREHAIAFAARSGLKTFMPLDDPAAHMKAYVGYVNNILMKDPAARRVVSGQQMSDVANWLRDSAEGQAHMRLLHQGDPHAVAETLLEMVQKYLPTVEMREAAERGRFNEQTVTDALPNVGSRPEIREDVNLMVHGNHPNVGRMRQITDAAMRLTGTLPDDIMVRHPIANSLYKGHMSSLVRQYAAQNGGAITAVAHDLLKEQATKLAKNDLKNLVYDVSRFNDAGHTLRFISPFFNAWFNAMSSWSKLFAENPGLLARGYTAKRALWNAPFAIDTQTGQRANDSTPMDRLSFVIHMPGPLAKLLGNQGTVPISAKELISPTYADSIGNPGWGPLATIPANSFAKAHPGAIDSPVLQYITGGLISANSMQKIIPSGVSEAVGVAQLLGVAGNPKENANYQKLVWSIYQEQMYDAQLANRSFTPNWGDIQKQASYLTALDYLVNRLSPLGFKPSPTHSYWADQYKSMLNQNHGNSQKTIQDFYDKFGEAPMVFAQSLHSNPSGVPATIEGVKAYKKYAGILNKYPDLAAIVIGPEGNGNFDDAAYQWEVANGLRTKLSAQDAAKQSNINVGWAKYGSMMAQINAELQARGLTSVNEANASDLKAYKANFSVDLSDPQSKNYNPDWYDSYGSYNKNAYQTRITNILRIAQDPALLANPLRSDIRSLQWYSQLRDWTYQQLQSRDKKSISAQSNWDIAQTYDYAVAQRMLADTKFAQLFSRFLEKDNFKGPA